MSLTTADEALLTPRSCHSRVPSTSHTSDTAVFPESQNGFSEGLKVPLRRKPPNSPDDIVGVDSSPPLNKVSPESSHSDEPHKFDDSNQSLFGAPPRIPVPSRLAQTPPPSHPLFDRTTVSSEEYIELLLFEIEELRAELAARDLHIARLTATKSANGSSADVTSTQERNSFSKSKLVADTESLDNPVRDLDLDNTSEPVKSLIVPSRSRRRSRPLSPSKALLTQTSFDTLSATIISQTLPHRTANSDPTTLISPVKFNSAYSSLHPRTRTSQHAQSNSPSFDRRILRSRSPLDTSSRHSRYLAGPIDELPSSTPVQNSSPGSRYGSPESPAAESAIDLPVVETSSMNSNAVPRSQPSSIRTHHRYNDDVMGKTQSIPHSLLGSPAFLRNSFHDDNSIHTPTNATFTGPVLSLPRLSHRSSSNINLTQSGAAEADPHQNGVASPFSRRTALHSTSSTSEVNSFAHSFGTPNVSVYDSSDNVSRTARPSVQTPGSSFSARMPKETDVCLLIKPEELHTVSVEVVSTVTMNATAMGSASSRKNDEPNCTFAVKEYQSQKEMWRVRKTYSQIHDLNAEVRYILEYFNLPDIPDRTLFASAVPLRMDQRMTQLQAYFSSLFAVPHMPQLLVYKLCRFLSLDFVSPLDEYRSGADQEGFLSRRHKGLVSSWRMKWCQVDGPVLEIYDGPGGQLIEQIALQGCHIGKQSDSAAAEDKGFRHAFMIMEPSRNKLASSAPRHVFCAETNASRDAWISTLVAQTGLPEYEEVSVSDTPASTVHSIEHVESTDRKASWPSILSMTSGTQLLPEEPAPPVPPPKDLKKSRMRSYFPFRASAKTAELSTATEADSSFDSSVSGAERASTSSILNPVVVEEDVIKRVFARGICEAIALSSHTLYGRPVPSILFRCIDYLTKVNAIHEEGIFRLSGLSSTIRQLKMDFDTEFDVNLFEHKVHPDMHTVSGLLKLYLRELRTPIMGTKTADYLSHLANSEHNSRLLSQLARDFKTHINTPGSIEQAEYDATYAIFKFLKAVIAQEDHNRMSLRNMCIVFVPTLNLSVEAVTMILEDFSFLFEDGPITPDDKRVAINVQIPSF